jgi:outer membrane biosynthesis protein TonB
VLALAVAVIVIAASGGDDAPATIAAAPTDTADPGSSEAPTPTPAPEPPPSPEAQPSTAAAPITPPAAATEPPKQEPPPSQEPSPAQTPAQEGAQPSRPEPAVAMPQTGPTRPTPPPPARFDVAIDSTPSGAELWLDGKLLGKTSHRGSLPRAERGHRITVRMKGHHEQTITVRPGTASKQNVKLVPVAHDKGVNPFD